MKRTIFLSVILCLFTAKSYSQTQEERLKISTYSNKTANQKQLAILQEEDTNRKKRLANFLALNPNLQKRTTFGEFGIQELMDVLPSGEKIYAKTYNEGAGITARANKLYNGGTLGLNIQGQNMLAGVWDGGNVRETHQEFMNGSVSKVSNIDGSTYAAHATHVMGTIIAKGVLPSVKGLAFNASGLSYNWDSDLVEMLAEASNGLLVSNHSYGFGVLGSVWFFGAYDSRAKQIDQMCYNNPFYLPVVSAGNSRNDTATPGSTQIANKFGYDMIFGHGNAKNVVTVAAVEQVNEYIGPTSVIMSSFSSWGPSDDGRVKPDISMKGVNVRSTLQVSNSATGFMDGTSMASPGITGVVLLLQQYYNQLNNTFMKSATAKGLLLHTADEAGFFPGPDYEYGWGLVNAERAAVTIKNRNSTTSNKSIIEELSLANNTTYTKTITANGINPLRVSISWTDPDAPTANSGINDPSTKYLVNDLDVKITKDGVTYYPWKLEGMLAPYSPATNIGTNDVDNFERIDINNPSGTYTITVTHKGTLTGGNQNFSLIATSDNLTSLGTNEVRSSKDAKVDFYPNPAKDFIKINEKDKDLSVNIYDVSGKLVSTLKLVDNKINISHLIKGNYFANFITSKGEIKSFKFIKE